MITPPPSGDVSVPLGVLPAGARIRAATATVGGLPYVGTVAKLQGARVTASPVVYVDRVKHAPTGAERAVIVDLGRSVSVLGIELTGGGAITLVLPWLGIDFSPEPAYESAHGDHAVALSGLETTKLLVQMKGIVDGAAPLADRLVITTATLPANVRASLNDRLAFWTHPGSLGAEVALTGLAEDLTALISSAGGDGVEVTLSLTTEAPGVLAVTLDPATGLQIDRTAEARWGGQREIDVPLAALAENRLTIPFPGNEDGAPWFADRLIVELRGAFPPWRAYPAQVTAAAGTLGLRVDATFSVARRLDVAEDSELHGVALLLRVPAAAELLVELLADLAGVPGAGKPIASAGRLLFAAGDDAQPCAWHDVLFDAPVSLGAATGAWLVVQAKTGGVEWVGAAEERAPATVTLGAAQGARWDPYPGPARGAVAVAQARILRRPFSSESVPLLELAWGDGGGDRVALEPGGESTTIELGRAPDSALTVPGAGVRTIEMAVTAAASGVLTLERTTTLYREAGQ